MTDTARPPSDYVRTGISRWQARSTTIASRGIVAAEHPLAAQAGAVMLARGGHAVDAAIAANAVMGVVAPMMNGVGGDLFAMVYDAGADAVHGLNASGWSPAALVHRFAARPRHDRDAAAGHPFRHRPRRRFRLGRIARQIWPRAARCDRPARDLPTRKRDSRSPRSSRSSGRAASRSCPLTRSAAMYLPNDRAPLAGEMFRNRRPCAHASRDRARRQRSRCTVARSPRASSACSDARGGTLAAADLADYGPEWVSPLTTNYRGWDVFEMPPNSQGIAALVMLNILEGFPIGRYGFGAPRRCTR